MLRHRLLTHVGLIALLAAGFVAKGQANEFATQRSTKEAFHPGLNTEYTFGEHRFSRVDNAIQLDIASEQPGGSASSDLTVTWQGYLQLKGKKTIRFHAFANGSVTVHCADKLVLESSTGEAKWSESKEISLGFGRHALRVEYRGTLSPPPVCGLYWSGTGFQLEPLPPQALWHTAESTPGTNYAQGSSLVSALRCAACHDFPAAVPPLPAPALTHLADNLRPNWLVDHLQSRAPTDFEAGRRMPYFALNQNDAAAIASALMDASITSPPPKDLAQAWRKANKSKKNPAPEPSAQQGGEIFASVGCLACHANGELGQSKSLIEQLFAGGNLNEISAKRTHSFLIRWLENPAAVNPHHRMPRFPLSIAEKVNLVRYLSGTDIQLPTDDEPTSDDLELGKSLIERHRCGTCHALPDSLTGPVLSKTELNIQSRWDSGCLQQPDTESTIPGFGLSATLRESIREFVLAPTQIKSQGKQLLVEKGCTACHQRGLSTGISKHLTDAVDAYPEIAPRLAALSPPAISGVGDKLRRSALENAVLRKTETLRPWLDVRMPDYQFTEQELAALLDHLIKQDRIPDHGWRPAELPGSDAAKMAASRLVTASGFGCQSCHAIGDMEAPQVDLKAKGTNLAMLGQRIRQSWFERWVHNPSRIVPRMEMPAIQTPATGVLGDDLDVQLAALWDTLNTPDFRPPRPGAVRIVRSQNLQGANDPAHVVSSVLETTAKTLVRPLLIGLPNRHNVLFDLEQGSLAGWWVGDTASQHTRGKTWYWESGNPELELDTLLQFDLIDESGEIWKTSQAGQLAWSFDAFEHTPDGLVWRGRMHFRAGERRRQIPIRLLISGVAGSNQTLMKTSVLLRKGDALRLRTSARVKMGDGTAELQFKNSRHTLRVQTGELMNLDKQRNIVLSKPQEAELEWQTKITTELPPESLPIPDFELPPFKSLLLDSVPGFEAVQLPLPRSEMPISLTWDRQGRLFMGSLKGQVFLVEDKDADGLHDHYEAISDAFPTPYGLHAHDDGLDVLTKFALLRVQPSSLADTPWDARVVADGWGYTQDYHDWAVGLERDGEGNYYIALPCQQDERSPAAAKFRGQALKLVPNVDSQDRLASHRSYRIESLSAGLRFPMGIVLTHAGDLFTTDNQGNYNPFNELNHLRIGKRYGFINRLENKDGFSPPFESPAINLPHPWTRSVNGVCELVTPDSLRADGAGNHFGPFEGHLLGSEMNGRFLIRMSLQRVGGMYQGAAYAFSRTPDESSVTFEGPIVCEVSPEGDIFVGNLHDSGWGGGQNTGSLVRVRPSEKLPLGIAEVRATREGFTIVFTGQVSDELAVDKSNYSIRSYRRVSTPAYGGDDQDESEETIRKVELNSDRTKAFIELKELKAGYVYELNLENIGDQAEEFFPSQAHYTMRALPE